MSWEDICVFYCIIYQWVCVCGYPCICFILEGDDYSIYIWFCIWGYFKKHVKKLNSRRSLLWYRKNFWSQALFFITYISMDVWKTSSMLGFQKFYTKRRHLFNSISYESFVMPLCLMSLSLSPPFHIRIPTHTLNSLSSYMYECTSLYTYTCWHI